MPSLLPVAAEDRLALSGGLARCGSGREAEVPVGGIGALFGYEIDLLLTLDPLYKPGLEFVPVCDYEQVLVVSSQHPLAQVDYVLPRQLGSEVLITDPVATDRLDIYNQFLLPAGIAPRLHKTIETTDIMLQMVASGRGVAALPRWLALE